MDFPLDFVRGSFPTLADSRFVFFDNGAGAQVPAPVVEAVSAHLVARNAQRGGRYRFSEEVDEVIRQARESLAVFLNAYETEEVVFGLNATGFIRQVSLALAEIFRPGDEVIVSELDHEANIAPWLALEKREVKVKFWPVEREGACLDIAKLDGMLTDRTRLVAVTKASNATGTIVDLIPIAERIHARGGYLFVDAVHFAPHGPLDVRFLGCDFIVCSGYKLFGPHMGFMWGKREILDSLPTFREYFVPDRTPDKFEVGTYSYEAVAGMNAAVGYIEELGRRSRDLPLAPADGVGRRGDLRRGMQAIRHYERVLSRQLLLRMQDLPGVTVYGIADPDRAALRTPTLCFNLKDVDPADVCRHLSRKGIFVRDGHLYCPRLLRALGLDAERGAVRASLVHYNNFEEVDRFAEALQSKGK
ncbi:MAG: cysteine desulfurase-like protein [Acidobacteriota bacterium]